MAAPAPAAAPDVSVVVSTRDRPNALARCLDALTSQEGAERMEVLVVDDGSTHGDDVRAAIRDPTFRLLRQDTRGAAAARNAGVRGTSAPVVLFLDDDCTASPRWVATMTRALRAGADVVAGRTGTTSSRPVAVAADLVTRHLEQRSSVPFASTGNLGCRRDIVDAFPFDESYRSAGEDREWCDRVTRAGHAITYLDDAVVWHDRHGGVASFWRRQLEYGRAAHRYHRDDRGYEHPSFYTDLVARGFRHGPGVGALICLSQLATAVGYADAAFAHLRSRSSR